MALLCAQKHLNCAEAGTATQSNLHPIFYKLQLHTPRLSTQNPRSG